MNSNNIQEKRKRSIIESEDETEYLSEKVKKIKSRKVTVCDKLCDSTEGELGNYYLDTFLNKVSIFKLFPHLKRNIRGSETPHVIVQQHLALVKSVGTSEQKTNLCVQPPVGVSEIDWVCLFAPFCAFFFGGAGAISPDGAEEVFGNNPNYNYRRINNFFIPYIFGKSNTANAKDVKSVDFLSLLPIEGEDLEFVKDYLGERVSKEKFFACPSHFNCWKKEVEGSSKKIIAKISSSGEAEFRKNKADGIQIVFNSFLNAGLNRLLLKESKKEVLIEFHSVFANSIANPNPNWFTPSPPVTTSDSSSSSSSSESESETEKSVGNLGMEIQTNRVPVKYVFKILSFIYST